MKATVANPAEFGRVAVMMGGQSSEREISLVSGRAVLAALQRCGVDAAALDFDRAAIRTLLEGGYDRVFNILHGCGGEDGVLQGMLDAMGIPYTGSGVLATALAMDKLRTKLVWLGAGIPTPEWCLLRSAEDVDYCAQRFGFPVVVKPASEGSSIGVGKAGTPDELSAALDNARKFRGEVFAERWVQGNEYTAAMLNGEMLPLVRLETPHLFYDFDAKYLANTTRYHCPCGLPPELEQRIQALCLDACRVLGVKGWARVDLMLDDCSEPWLFEVNTVPGMTDHSLVPMAAQAVGIGFDRLVWRILETSLAASA